MIDGVLHHIALLADWDAARHRGRYEVSTLGRSLAEVGFIHACQPAQVAGVLDRFYAGVEEPLVLLVVDPDRVGSEVREEAVAGTDERFPHIYGPVPVEAVVDVRPVVAGE